MKTKEVFNAISISYDGVDLTSLETLHAYGEYICELFDDDEKHVASLLLHTGSEYYQVIAVVVAALKILLHSNTDMDELLQSLKVGDLLLVDGQRAKFLGVKDGSRLGIGFLPGRQYFCIETGNGASKSAPLEQAKRWNISRYQGDAVGLGGKGVKDSLEERRKFIACFCGQKEQKNVSTEINSSIAVLAGRDFAERVYKKVSVTYSKRTVPFSKLVTAAYVSENESYQIGSNPVKEEAIIKFYSKISSCRNDILEDRERRIAACIACDEKDWISNSEIHDIADRRSLRAAFLLGRTHYTDYKEWLQDDRYKVCAIVPEIAASFTHDKSFFDSARDFNAEFGRWARHRISTAVIDGGWSVETEKEVKRNLISIKNECFSCELKDLFLISAYFLLNLCRTAFFPLKYCDKAFDAQIISWKPSARFDQMTQFMATLTGEMKSAAENVYNILREAVNGLYEINPKGQFLLSRIQERKVKYIVTPKAYYRSLMNLWLNDVGVAAAARPQIITTNELHSSEQCYDDVIFVTPYFDLTFNPYAELSFSSGEVVCYAYEQLKERKLKRLVSYGQRKLRERNWFRYDLQSAEEDENTDSVNEEFSRIADETDDSFEAEMEQLSRELQMQGAKKYVAGSHTSGDGTVQIATIVGFASGSIGFFTKYYKAYVLRNESIDEIGQEDLKVGDSIVFTKETENKDIVDTILLKLFETTLSQSELHRQYLLSRYWKEKLKSYIGTNGVSYREFARQLGNVGCQKHEVTVRSWLYEESHVVGPFDAEDYEAMDKIVRFEYSPAEIKEACDAVRSLRRKVLGLLAKAIIRRMSSENSDPIWDSVLSNAENLSQIEQIISINSTEDEKYIPLNLVNKPIEI